MSSSAVDPINFPQVWDAVFVGGQFSPGVCQLSGFKRAFQFDVKKGKGALGATVTFVQRPPAEGTIKFLLWLPFHFGQWDQFRPLLKYDPTKKAVQAIDIYHPSLNDLEITSVVCKSIGAIEHEGNQLYSITVEVLEYFPPPKASAVSTPSTSTGTSPGGSSSPGTQPPNAQDAQQKEIADLLKQAQAP